MKSEKAVTANNIIRDLFAKGLTEDEIYWKLKEIGYDMFAAQFYLDQFINQINAERRC